MARIKQQLLQTEDTRRRATCLGELAQDGIELIAELGPDFPVPEVGTRLRCSGCSGKDIATRPAWPGLGQVARHGQG
jgi:hypothetical protein